MQTSAGPLFSPSGLAQDLLLQSWLAFTLRLLTPPILVMSSTSRWTSESELARLDSQWSPSPTSPLPHPMRCLAPQLCGYATSIRVDLGFHAANVHIVLRTE